MNVTRNQHDQLKKTPQLRDEPESWRRSRAICRITGGMNTGIRTLHADGPRPATPAVFSPAALREGRYRLVHDVPERLRNLAESPQRRLT